MSESTPAAEEPVQTQAASGPGGTAPAPMAAAAPGWFTYEPPRWLPRAIVTSTLIVFALYSAWWISIRLADLLVILLSALFLGFALEPAVSWWARRGMRRGAATLLVYAIILMGIALFVYAFGSLVVEQVVAIAQSLPSLLEGLTTWLDQNFNVDLQEQIDKLSENLASLGGTVATTALDIGTTLVSSIFTLFTILLFGFYIAAEGPKLRRNVCSLLPPGSQREVLRIWDIAVTKTAGYIYSRTLLAACSAFFTTIFLAVIDIPNALTLGIFVGVVSQFVPTVGTYIAGALPVLVALTISPWKALLVLAFILIYQQFENYILTPPLSSRTMEIHPAVAFGSVIAGAALLGAIGALIALPAAATIQASVSAYIQRRDLVDSPLFDEPPQPTSMTRKSQVALSRLRRKVNTASHKGSSGEQPGGD